jgi:hypothetical protein
LQLKRVAGYYHKGFANYCAVDFFFEISYAKSEVALYFESILAQTVPKT